MLLSSPRLRRDPDERKERIGATRTEVVGVLAAVALKDTGGREAIDFRFSSVGLAFSNVFGSISSRCPLAQSFVVLSPWG